MPLDNWYGDNDGQFNSGPSNNRNFGNTNQKPNTKNFYDDFDLNEFAKNINTLDRLVNINRNMNTRHNFTGNSGNSSNDNSWSRNQDMGFNARVSNTNSFGGSNQRFNNDGDQDDNRSGQHCIHMRGLPYYSDEMDVFNVSIYQTENSMPKI